MHYFNNQPYLQNSFYQQYPMYQQPNYSPYLNWNPYYTPRILQNNNTLEHNRRVNLGDVAKTVTNTVNDVKNNTEQLINNTVGDIQSILGNVAACAREMDRIRLRVTNRAIEYQTVVMRQVLDSKVLPVGLIDKVWDLIGWRVKKNPNPRIFRLENPKNCIWDKSESEILTEINENAPLPPDKIPYVFVHGIQNGAFKSEAFKFYRNFELAARMFNPSNPQANYSNVDIYIVSYDSKLTDEEGLIIREGISSVLASPVSGDAPDLYAAVMWKEWERRAQITAENKILPFLKQISQSNIKGANAITHSLGCYALAYAANKFFIEQPSMRPPFYSWFCMAAAIPANSFTSTGIFNKAPFIAGIPDNPGIGTSVWFSYLDSALSTLYVIANKYAALGQTGALQSQIPVTNIDTSRCTKGVHMVDEVNKYGVVIPGYFTLLGPLIRSIFRTEESSHPPDCALVVR
ncbi:hypothetical protein PDN31_15295 [Bacillus cereus]|nr:hypothetical protein [Bacillus cereus]MDA2133716.1 hypothetical protein [Bacillus cereus]